MILGLLQLFDSMNYDKKSLRENIAHQGALY